MNVSLAFLTYHLTAVLVLVTTIMETQPRNSLHFFLRIYNIPYAGEETGDS